MFTLFLALLTFVKRFKEHLQNPEFKALALVVLGFLIIGTIFYNQVEGWSLFDSLYFSVITLATVGYGDLTPHTFLGKLFTMIYILLGVGTLVTFVTMLADGAGKSGKKRK